MEPIDVGVDILLRFYHSIINKQQISLIAFTVLHWKNFVFVLNSETIKIQKVKLKRLMCSTLPGYDEGAVSRGHHHKKKKIKAIKKAIIKLVLIALLIKHKLKMLLTAFQTFLQFKAVLLATIYVLIHVAKLWIEIKHKHHPQKVRF